MNHHLLAKICGEINSCPNWKNGDIECGRDIHAIPKTVEIRETQRIMLITRDPSNQANKLKDVTDYKNSFLREKVLPILFLNYEVSKANCDKTYFENYKETFLNLFYWTHYQKCFPGIKNGSHKQPREKCAKKYLKYEIEAFKPELIICMGNHAIKYITGEKKLLNSISNNGKIGIMISGKKVPVISITHPSDANGAKHNPSYKYKETIELIHDNLSSYLESPKKPKIEKETIIIKGAYKQIQNDKSIEIIEKLRDPVDVTHPPALRKTTMDHLDINDPFFDSLKREYPEFEDWFKKKSIAKAVCFVHFRDDGLIGALLIYKIETDAIDSIPFLFAKKRLKISTFKVKSLGNKIGELFIKLAIEYAIKNDIDEIYLTHFVEEKDYLIDLIVNYGFYKVGKLVKNSESVYLKEIRVNTNETETLNPLGISNKYYPSFKDGFSIRKFIVPIIPKYHQRLFTEYKLRQTAILEYTSEFVVEGNTIRKAYFSHSRITKIRPGDILLFYRSKNKKLGSMDQAEITSLGIVEKIEQNVKDIEEINRNIKNRTVYKPEEIKEMLEKQTMLILFTWHFHLPNPLKLKDLMQMKVLKAPPESIIQISHEKYILVKKRGRIDERFTID